MKLISNRIKPKSPLYTEMIVNGCKFEGHFVTNIINQFASDSMTYVFIFRNARQISVYLIFRRCFVQDE
ncbi:unnamed protein product [Lactuca virosa]|uniref:Sulfotransferase n=1 Tax=Lactuca virosa TaxID=75947 RepID=A0AAU9M8X5_9ASTR|nr:unnamed protein product [Lactuca virosa]